MLSVWADDDLIASTFGRYAELFRRRGMEVLIAGSVNGALRIMSDLRANQQTVSALLVDTILPTEDFGGALSPTEGLTLARRAVEEYGIRSLVFITVSAHDVVPREVELWGTGLIGGVLVVPKTTLLNPGKVEDIIGWVRKRSEEEVERTSQPEKAK